MRRMPMGLIVCIFLFCGGNLLFASGETRNNSTAHSPQEVNHLRTIIRNKNLQTTDPECVIKAINRLGELKARAAINDLAQLLTFKQNFNLSRYPEIQPPGGIDTPFTWYPATKALHSIGKISLPALIRVIESQPSGSVANENAWYTIFALYRESLSEAAKHLKMAAAKANTPGGSKRLSEAAEKLEALERKLQQPHN